MIFFNWLKEKPYINQFFEKKKLKQKKNEKDFLFFKKLKTKNFENIKNKK
jgi:hypothetical protein